MGQPVRLSDSFVADARATGAIAERLIAGQVEFWTRLGRSADLFLLLGGGEAMALRKSGDAVPLSELLVAVDSSAGRQHLEGHLAGRPYPNFEPAAGQPGMLVRIEADGNRTVDQFEGREFRPVTTLPKQTAKTPPKEPAKARKKPAIRTSGSITTATWPSRFDRSQCLIAAS